MNYYFSTITLFLFTTLHILAQSTPQNAPDFKATQFDIGVTALDLPKWIPNNIAYIEVSGKVRNFGVQPISYFWVNYQIDGGEIFEHKVTDIVLLQNNEQAFVFPETIEPVAGNYTIKVWGSLPNGQEDENPKNDTVTFSYTVYNIHTTSPRTILLEGFTASSCAPCVQGNINLKKVLEENEGAYTLIKYQMDFPGLGDPYYTTEAGTRGWFYFVNNVPTICVDGSAFKTSTTLLKNSDLINRQIIPAFMALDVNYYVEDKTVYAEAKIMLTEEISTQDLKLYMAIVEKKTFNNVGSNGEKEFEQVMKKFMPNAAGIALDTLLTVNTPYVTLQNWEFKGDYRLPDNASHPINHEIEHSVENFDSLTVVAWVQNSSNKTVYQAANGVKTTETSVTYHTKEPLSNVKLYPNPFQDNFTITNTENVEKITVLNFLGQEVKARISSAANTITVAGNEWASGIYFIKIEALNGEQVVRKMLKR